MQDWSRVRSAILRWSHGEQRGKKLALKSCGWVERAGAFVGSRKGLGKGKERSAMVLTRVASNQVLEPIFSDSRLAFLRREGNGLVGRRQEIPVEPIHIVKMPTRKQRTSSQ